MTSNFRKLLRFVLWPRMWSILVYVPRALGKNVYSAIVGIKCSLNVSQLLLVDGVAVSLISLLIFWSSSINC